MVLPEQVPAPGLISWSACCVRLGQVVLGGVPIWTLTHSETVGWSQMRNSRNQMRRSREIRLQLLNISALFFPLPSPPPSPSSLPVSIAHSATHLRRYSRFRGWLSSTAVAQRSCLTVKKKKNCLLLEGVSPRPRVVRRTPAVSRSAVSRQMSVDDLAAMPL